jgi:hypothetical protein
MNITSKHGRMYPLHTNKPNDQMWPEVTHYCAETVRSPGIRKTGCQRLRKRHQDSPHERQSFVSRYHITVNQQKCFTFT